MREFKTAAIRTVAAASLSVRKIRVDDEVFRKLRLQMLATAVTRDHLSEALTVIMRQIAERATTRTVRFADVVDLIRGPPDVYAPAPVVTTEETERDDGESADAPTWQVSRVLDRFKGADGVSYCLVEWEQTTEPAANIPGNLLAAFDRERRLLVRETYFEDQAEKA